MSDGTHGADAHVGALMATGWKWFEFHAKQRLDAFKFFLTIYSGVGAAGAILYDRAFFRLAMFLGFIALCVCLVFWRLDIRSRRLTEFGEDAIEAAMREEGIPENLNPIVRARERARSGMRFKTAFGLTFNIAASASIALILMSLPDGLLVGCTTGFRATRGMSR